MAGEKAQKRGGGSMGGGSGVNKVKENSGFYGTSEVAGHVHEDEYEYTSSISQRQQWLQEQFPELTKTKIENMEDAVSAWSGSAYSSIRALQQGQSWAQSEITQRRADILEFMIKNSPKFYGKPIYRGINVDKDTYDNIISQLSAGGRVTMLGTSSWTSNKSVAKKFTDGSGKNIVFISEKGTKAGVSIQHLSIFGKKEREVLVSKITQYGANKIVESGNTAYVYVDEYVG